MLFRFMQDEGGIIKFDMEIKCQSLIKILVKNYYKCLFNNNISFNPFG